MDVGRVFFFGEAEEDGPSIDIRILLHLLSSFLVAHAAVFKFEVRVLPNQRPLLLLLRILLHVLLGVGILYYFLQLPIHPHLKRPRYYTLRNRAHQLHLRVRLPLLLEGGVQTRRANNMARRNSTRLDHNSLAQRTLMHPLRRRLLIRLLHLQLAALSRFYHLPLIKRLIIGRHHCAVEGFAWCEFVPLHFARNLFLFYF